MKRIIPVMIAALGLMIAAPAWAGDTQPGPRQVIEQTVNNIINVLNERTDKTKLTEADREHIRQTVEGRFDYQVMARRSLGRPWKKLSKDERNHFTDVFRELMERSYGNRLNEYKGQTVRFQDAELKKKKARVESTVIDGARETPVEYRLHQTKTGWQVYDIRIEGTSMIRTFHQDFKSVLDNGGYSKLLKTLEDKVAKLRQRDQA